MERPGGVNKKFQKKKKLFSNRIFYTPKSFLKKFENLSFHGATRKNIKKNNFIVNKFFIFLKNFLAFRFFIFQGIIHEIKNSKCFLFHGATWCSQKKKKKKFKNNYIYQIFYIPKSFLYFLIFYILRTNL